MKQSYKIASSHLDHLKMLEQQKGLLLFLKLSVARWKQHLIQDQHHAFEC